MFKNNFMRVALDFLLSFLGLSLVAFSYKSIAFPIVGISVFLLINVFPSFISRPSFALRMSSDGADLLITFLANAVAQLLTVVFGAIFVFGWFGSTFWLLFATYAVADIIIFWNGILRVYFSSPIIGLKWRVLGIVFGFVPIANIIVLCKIISLVRFDVKTEEERFLRNQSRQCAEVCKTKYPLVFVHGVFFRDARYLDYWGRIPDELKKNGATVFYGNQQSALSVEQSGHELASRIEQIVSKTGCEKVNIIAHSKGGLDCRYAISQLGADKLVASLTTVNTPHRGCAFADWLIDKAPTSFKHTVANTYNSALKRLGDSSPDFLSAVNDLRASFCEDFNSKNLDSQNVFYQSTAGKINKPVRNVFPLCFTNSFVKLFDGENDGLVSANSAKWGEKFYYLTSNSPEGISHADVIDMSRHNRKDFDVLEFYVDLVSGLKQKGF